MRLTSKSFSEGGIIPAKYTCDGADVSPELSWSELPEGTQSLALIVDDPDAPGRTFVHWVIFNIGSNRSMLGEGGTYTECVEGVNDMGNNSYSGPCPPTGRPHSYHFKLYALDTRLSLKRGSTKREVEKAAKGHIIGTAELVAKYGR